MRSSVWLIGWMFTEKSSDVWVVVLPCDVALCWTRTQLSLINCRIEHKDWSCINKISAFDVFVQQTCRFIWTVPEQLVSVFSPSPCVTSQLQLPLRWARRSSDRRLSVWRPLICSFIHSWSFRKQFVTIMLLHPRPLRFKLHVKENLLLFWFEQRTPFSYKTN